MRLRVLVWVEFQTPTDRQTVSAAIALRCSYVVVVGVLRNSLSLSLSLNLSVSFSLSLSLSVFTPA